MKIKILTFLCCFILGTLVVIYLIEKHLSETPLVYIQPPITEYKSTIIVEKNKLDRDLDELYKADEEREIWSGESGGYRVRWTNKDIYVESEKSNVKLLTNYFARYAERNFKYRYDWVGKNHKRVITGENDFNDCPISLTGRLVSLVGPYATIETEEMYVCGVIQYYSHWIVIDLRKPNKINFTAENTVEDGEFSGSVKLTDIFSEHEILTALLENENVLRRLGTQKPRSIREILLHFENLYNDQFDDDEKTIAVEDVYFIDDGIGFLSNRYLYGFTFDSIEGDKICIKIGLAPMGKTHEVPSITLKMNIPDNLKPFVTSAKAKKEGYLFSDYGKFENRPYWTEIYLESKQDLKKLMRSKIK